MSSRSPAHRTPADSPRRHAMRNLPARRRAGEQIHVPAPFANPLAPVPSGPTLLPLIGANDELLPTFERTLTPIAIRAKSGDIAARDALYFAFEPKILRFVRRIRVPFAPEGSHGIWERDDVRQEAYLAFLGIIESWSPGIPFGRYMLANFPWRLRDAVHRGVGRRTVPPRTAAVASDQLDWLADRSTEAEQARALIEVLISALEPPLNDVLRLHILDGETLTAIAARLGLSRRTVSRYWRAILIRLRGTALASPAGSTAPGTSVYQSQ